MNELMFIWTSSYLVIMGIHDTYEYISTYYLPEGLIKELDWKGNTSI